MCSRNDYGFMGPALCQAVIKARNAPPSTTTPTSSSISNAPITSAAATASAVGRPQVTQIK